MKVGVPVGIITREIEIGDKLILSPKCPPIYHCDSKDMPQSISYISTSDNKFEIIVRGFCNTPGYIFIGNGYVLELKDYTVHEVLKPDEGKQICQ